MDNYFGIHALFVRDFVTEEMEPAFPEIAREYLRKEPLIRKGTLFKEIPFPYDEEKSAESLYYETILGTMIVCINNGSKYAKSVLTEVYKTYYKQEYGVLKKFSSMGSDELMDFCEGNEDIGRINSICARVATMCEVMGIRLDDSCDSIIDFINTQEKEKRTFWRQIEAAAQDGIILEKRSEERRRFAAQITDENPEIVSRSAYENCRGYKVLNDMNLLVRLATQEKDTQSAGYLCDGFDLYTSMIDVYEELISTGHCKSNPRKGVRLDDYSFREKILLSGIRHLASEYAKLYCIRREELWSMLGVSRMEIASDTEIENDIISKEMIKKLADSKGSSDVSDHKYHKLTEKIRALGEKIPDESFYETDEKPEPETDTVYDGIAEEDIVAVIDRELKEQKRRVKEAENKAGTQRILYEECREKVKALEKVVEELEDEHFELVALRELVYNLEHPELEDNEQAAYDKASELKGVKIAIIGGQDAWANRIKKVFPGWVFIPAGESLGLDRALGGVHTAFFLTDSISHAMYYKMLGTVRSNGIPFHFLHVRNIDQVIESVYRAVKEEEGRKP